MGGRAIATLYMIMMSHPVDRRGRCRSCRRPGTLIGRCWRRCRVHGEANVWLHQPTEFLRSQLARELRLDAPPPEADTTPGHPSAGDPDDTAVLLPSIDADPCNSRASIQAPVVSPSASLPGGFPRSRWPVSVHGRAGKRPPPAPTWSTTGPDSVQPRQRAGDARQPAMPALTTLVIGGGYALGLLAATTRTRTIATGGVS